MRPQRGQRQFTRQQQALQGGIAAFHGAMSESKTGQFAPVGFTKCLTQVLFHIQFKGDQLPQPRPVARQLLFGPVRPCAGPHY
ncbi:Uncharacterised protein [Ewingella americana]|uniref:Uncharacterized protein n=1 Tax=Ewingella americana TaxID=41202 RepID=A0A377N9K6_9GAMM|nr:Uncharacterised protein [Ewingella americana]